MPERFVIIVFAFILDIILGDPHIPFHPIRLIGRFISCAENLLVKTFGLSEEREECKGKKLFAGGILFVSTVFVSVAVPFVILYIAERINHNLRLITEIIMCYFLIAARSLREESMKVYSALESNDTDLAKKNLSMIVGRDTQNLSREGIIKATVETIAENTSDGVIAPLFYIFLFGSLGGFLYKSVNTLDSMVGYKNDRYIYLGRVSAYADDIVNFIPSRLSALFMLLSALLLRLDYRNALRIFRRDRRAHSSPNSAMTESVCAGALSVRLGGDAYYSGVLYNKPYIGDDIRKPEDEDIVRANNMLFVSSLCALFSGFVIICILRELLFLKAVKLSRILRFSRM